MYLGLDVGTQGTKAVVYCAKTNRIVSRGAHSYGVLESAKHPGRAEQAPATWVDGCVSSIKQALQGTDAASQIMAIGVSGQQHGLVVLDADGKVGQVFLYDTDLSSCSSVIDVAPATTAAMQCYCCRCLPMCKRRC
jgi:sugar (pentulose or hexulose) kinase